MTPSVPAPAPPILSTPHRAAVSYSAKLCSNCGHRGHLAPTCFEAGGGMEGQRAEYKKDRNKVIVMRCTGLETQKIIANARALNATWGEELLKANCIRPVDVS